MRSGNDGRSSVRWEPDWRLILQPILRRAARTRLALVLWWLASCSSGLKRDVDELGWGLTMFEPLSDHTKGERLDAGNGLVPVFTVGHDAGQCGYFGQPTAVVFSLNLNRECHEVNVPSGLAV